ncbi:hypothetical protein [Halobacillus sp. Marseille-P3879]|uniref:hypothetical protein n=1 Tax=Halobacillus sp. Marseille-P3879 TaxID=2045014 RepID=UPI000C7A3121|nr:hypothetical protein [Halobacillus sp. Marseille-P3879]
MRKAAFCCILAFILQGGAVSAVSWAYPFVVWNGGVYQVTEETVEEVGKVIGEVETKPDEEGNYRGNASNAYEIGTKYYSISDSDPKEEIAVEDGNQYVKAVYENKAPKSASFYIYTFFLSIAVIVSAVLIYLRFQKNY